MTTGFVGTGRLAGKVAIITGSAQGMGEGHARAFVGEGASVVVADIRDAEGEALAQELGNQAAFVHLDVTDEDGWTNAIAAASNSFGGVDVLVNNAGVSFIAPLEHTELSDYRRVIDINQVGVFLGMKAVIGAMTARGGGSIVNVSSVDGLVATPLSTAYVASKFAVRGMTKVAAAELAAAGIRVNSLHPGMVHTPMMAVFGDDPEALFAQEVPLQRFGTPAEIAALAVFLASDESSYCTGAEFIADGGMTCAMGVAAVARAAERMGAS